MKERLSLFRKKPSQEALAAYGLFVAASIETPNSIHAQAAVIARECLGKNIEPLRYLEQLVNNKTLLTKIANQANLQHERSGNKTRIGNISKADVKRIAIADFQHAHFLIQGGITAEGIQAIINKRRNGAVDGDLGDYIRSMLAQQK